MMLIGYTIYNTLGMLVNACIPNNIIATVTEVFQVGWTNLPGEFWEELIDPWVGTTQ